MLTVRPSLQTIKWSDSTLNNAKSDPIFDRTKKENIFCLFFLAFFDVLAYNSINRTHEHLGWLANCVPT